MTPTRRGRRAASKTPTADYAAGCRVRSTLTKCPTTKSRTHPHRQSHAEKMPRFQDPIPGDPQRAWQRRANPVFIDPLHLAPESTLAMAESVCRTADWNAAARLPGSCSHLWRAASAAGSSRVFPIRRERTCRWTRILRSVDQSSDGERSLLCRFSQGCIIAIRGSSRI